MVCMYIIIYTHINIIIISYIFFNITMEKNPKAKLAKDASAGAVLVMAIISVIIGLMIFMPKILECLK